MAGALASLRPQRFAACGGPYPAQRNTARLVLPNGAACSSRGSRVREAVRRVVVRGVPRSRAADGGPLASSTAGASATPAIRESLTRISPPVEKVVQMSSVCSGAGPLNFTCDAPGA